jgi:hypothetical protein
LHKFLTLWFFQQMQDKSLGRPLLFASEETAQENGHADEVLETSEHDAIN